jgi:transcriptional regulator with XRE-family HTH domain
MVYEATEAPPTRRTGDSLRSLRSGFKQSDVAAEMGVSARWVSYIESQRWPSPLQADRFAAAVSRLYERLAGAPQTLSGAKFRKVYASLAEPTIVTVHGHPIGQWIPANPVFEPAEPGDG